MYSKSVDLHSPFVPLSDVKRFTERKKANNSLLIMSMTFWHVKRYPLHTLNHEHPD